LRKTDLDVSKIKVFDIDRGTMHNAAWILWDNAIPERVLRVIMESKNKSFKRYVGIESHWFRKISKRTENQTA